MGTLDELSDDIMRGIVDEAPEMGDPECTVMYPTIFLMDEEKVVPDGRIKGHSPSGPAVVAIVDGNLAFAARIQLGLAPCLSVGSSTGSTCDPRIQ